MRFNHDHFLDVAFWGAVSYSLACIVSAAVGLFNFWLFFIAAWSVSAGACLYLASQKLPIESKAVFVTGCDTGIGLALAIRLHEMGFRVFAGCLQADMGGDGAEKLRGMGSNRLHVLQLDVTKKEQIQDAVIRVKELLPEGETLWGLINNSGVSGFGEVEWVSTETYRRIFDVNVFGLMDVTKGFLPLIRRAQGRVVNMGSVCGRIGRGGMSPYVSSKFAVEGFSDCLRCEMKYWGVEVCIIEPSNFSAGTQITAPEYIERQVRTMKETMSEEVKEDYGEAYIDHAVTTAKLHSSSGLRDVTPILDAVGEALTQQHPRARYTPVTNFYFGKLFVVSHLPEWVYSLLYTTSWHQQRR